MTKSSIALSTQRQTASVKRVIDGDTIEVDIGGASHTIRYIGVDTPETKHPQKGVECFGPEATEFNKLLVENNQVSLEKDISETDRYGRLLRYVWLEDGRMVNEVLVSKGYARVSTYPPDKKHEDVLLSAEAQAIDSKVGLWGKCDGIQTSGRGAVDSTITPHTGGNCSSYYPTVCIPDPPPDLDCGEVGFRNFEVLAEDPHRFDWDMDGVGCEN